MRPIAACAEIVVERTRVSQVTPANTRHSPRSGFNGLLRALPGDRLSCHRHQRKLPSANFDASTGASGPHDFSVRQPHRPSSAPPASTASRSAFRDVAQRPSEERDGDGYKLIWLFGKSEYFFESGWTAKLMDGLICPSGRGCQPLQLYPENRVFGAGEQVRKLRTADLHRSAKCSCTGRRTAVESPAAHHYRLAFGENSEMLIIRLRQLSKAEAQLSIERSAFPRELWLQIQRHHRYKFQ